MNVKLAPPTKAKNKAVKFKPAPKPKGKKGNPAIVAGNKVGKQFGPGNKAAEEFGESWAIETFTAMYNRLIENEALKMPDTANPTRANDIKLLKEICLIFNITPSRFCYMQDKFCLKTKKITDENGETKVVPNENYSFVVAELIEQIKAVCECRLVYSGSSMDTFILKNHYDFVDAIDHTTKGQAINMPTTPRVTIIENT